MEKKSIREICLRLSDKYKIRPDMTFYLNFMDDILIETVLKQIRHELLMNDLDWINNKYRTNLNGFELAEIQAELEGYFQPSN